MDLTEAKLTQYKNSERHPWEMARLKVITSLIDKYIISKSKKTITVFDIGCGDTFVAEALSDRYPEFEFAAIDLAFTDKMISEFQQKFSKFEKKINLFKSTEEAENKLNKKVDLILLLDVVEHIENDRLFLQQLAGGNCINQDTILIITVPAFQSLFCSHDVFLKHFRRYNNSDVSKVLKSSGFEICSKGYFFSLLVFFRIIQVIREKIIKPKTQSGIGNWKGGKIVGRLMYFILITDYFITKMFKKIRINIPGLSNFAVCRKHVS